MIYIDPWKIPQTPHDATYILVSHSHYDHLSIPDVDKVSTPQTRIVAPKDVTDPLGRGDILLPGGKIQLGNITVEGVAAYNPAKKFHPKANNWLGFIINLDGLRIYYAGDTDLTDEMKVLKNIDLALMPVGGTYTFNAEEAAEALTYFKPARAIPYHYGDIVGEPADAQIFAEKAPRKVTILKPGQSCKLEKTTAENS